MALLKLQDIGKIYVSEGSVAVGIRGVNLSFDKGEFVAVTGKSGSGKSTLLNVISGMDTYEEGEMLIEGNVTSHYLQPDWEQYRQEYISFIFQDYNIIESFTVLQNVELALMNIENAKERRERALELLTRVGMRDWIHQKGSKLSGGQKQRTVIARALAKDSPIILADEPTGNLDSKTSEEIISLLREVSKDKLLIIVTHNFEQVEHYATRHIRIFDGAVESDTLINQPCMEDGQAGEANIAETYPAANVARANKKKESSPVVSDLKKSFALGKTIFTSKPKFTTFLCILLILAMVAVFTITALCGSYISLFKKYYMFHHTEGRVVVSSREGILSEEQVKNLSEEYGAQSYIMIDKLLDITYGNTFWSNGVGRYVELNYTYGKNYGNKVLGRYPEADNEALLYLPISCQPVFGDKQINITSISANLIRFNVVGIKYYYDNTKTSEMLLTENGFKTLSYLYCLNDPMGNNFEFNLKYEINPHSPIQPEFREEGILKGIYPYYGVEEGKIYINDVGYQASIDYYQSSAETTLTLGVSYRSDSGFDGNVLTKVFTDKDLTNVKPEIESGGGNYDGIDYSKVALVHPSVFNEVAVQALSKTYNQFSLFFKNDGEAHRAETKLREAGYSAACSDTEYQPEFYEIFGDVMLSYTMMIIWLCCVIFIALFMYICTMRMLNAFKNDTAIMRSMGIPVKIIRLSMYVRMLIALIPALISLVAVALTVYLIPVMNGMFLFLHWWQYGMIILGMLFIALFVTHRQIRRIFRTSVKKSLKGENL